MVIKTVIVDQQNALSQAHRIKLEEILDLNLKRFSGLIRHVKFRVIQTSNEKYNREHYVLLMVFLKTGKPISIRVTRFSVEAAIIVATDAACEAMIRRERFHRWPPVRLVRNLMINFRNWVHQIRTRKALQN